MEYFVKSRTVYLSDDTVLLFPGSQDTRQTSRHATQTDSQWHA